MSYWWFSGATLTALRQAMNNNPTRLEVHIDADQKMTLHVVGAQVAVLNESHICPPQCP